MKIAYLMIAYKNAELLKRTISSFHPKIARSSFT